MNWKKVTNNVRIDARGDLSDIPEHNRGLFALPCETGTFAFQPISKVPKGYWLREHEEKGQSMKSFLRGNFRAQVHGSFHTIYIQPLGDFTGPRCPSLQLIEEYIRPFFAPAKIKMLKSTPIESVAGLTSRTNDYTKNIQLKTGDVLQWMQMEIRKDRNRIRNQVCSIALTMYDVYPDDNWNFVFGLADMVEGMGVWSLARMDPQFPDTSLTTCMDEEMKIILLRSVKVLTHEICHLFGLRHCIYYECLMNGSNSQEENDQKSSFLCPICLRKLHVGTKITGVDRYKGLLEWREKVGHAEEAKWLNERIREITL